MFTPNLVFLCPFCFWARNLYGIDRQTDRRTNRQEWQCGLLGEQHNNARCTLASLSACCFVVCRSSHSSLSFSAVSSCVWALHSLVRRSCSSSAAARSSASCWSCDRSSSSRWRAKSWVWRTYTDLDRHSSDSTASNCPPTDTHSNQSINQSINQYAQRSCFVLFNSPFLQTYFWFGGSLTWWLTHWSQSTKFALCQTQLLLG